MEFSGRHDHRIDEKGRVSLPVEFRALLSAENGPPMITMSNGGRTPCLLLRPHSEWESFMTKLKRFHPDEDGVWQIYDTVVAEARPVEADKMGRILVPANLRAFAQLDKDVVWVGQLDVIKLWSKTNWDNQQRAAMSPVHQAAMDRIFAQLRG